MTDVLNAARQKGSLDIDTGEGKKGSFQKVSPLMGLFLLFWGAARLS